MATFSRLLFPSRVGRCPPVAHVLGRVSTRSYYVKPKEKRGPQGSTQAWLLLAGVTLAVGGVSLYILGRPEDTIIGLQYEPDKYANENIIKAYLLRARDNVAEFKRNYTEPSQVKLLPELLPPPYQRRYTLLIEVKDILIHSEYDRLMGWKHQKRPGLDAFLNRLFDYYEIVIFTSENALSMHPIIDKMDPNQFILYRLYRDSTKYVDGHHVKDLSHVNRSLNRVVILDTDPSSIKYQPENSVILNKWTGDIYDTTLDDLASFLLTIAVSDTDDVRPVLDYYKSCGNNILETFKGTFLLFHWRQISPENQAKLREAEEKRQAVKTSTNKELGGSINVFSLGKLGQQHAVTPLDTPTEAPPTSTPTDEDQSWSVTKWISTWIGIK